MVFFTIWLVGVNVSMTIMTAKVISEVNAVSSGASSPLGILLASFCWPLRVAWFTYKWRKPRSKIS